MDSPENPPAVTLKIRSGCEGGGKGAIWQKDKSATLGCNNDQTVFVPKCYGVCSKASHSMMSDNPHSGFYEAETSRTLDRSGGDPTCNQGGLCICEPVVCVDQGGGKSNCTVDEQVAPPLTCTHGGAPTVAFTQNQRDEVRDLGETAGSLSAQPGMKQQTFVAQPDDVTAFHVNQRNELIDLHGKSGALMATRSDQMQTFVLQGNMIGRKDENGPQGDGINEDVCFTLDATDRHAVCAPEDAIGAQQPKGLKKLRAAQVSVLAYTASGELQQGQGTLISEDGIVIAQYDVMKGATRATVVDMAGNEHQVTEILGANGAYNIVRMRMEPGKKKNAYLTIAPQQPTEQAQVFIMPSEKADKNVPCTIDFHFY